MESTATSSTFAPVAVGPDDVPGFNTIDGYFVSSEDGEAALLSGRAVLVGGLLVVFFAG